jgi:sugar lactone lactonase YvrE
MMRFIPWCMVVPLAGALFAGPSGDQVPTRTIRPEYFIRGLCAGVHSIFFDDSGHMWVGGLGDKPPDLRQLGPKKVYRIGPDRKIDVAAEVECTFTTAIIADASGQIYVACEGPTKIVRISKDGVQTQLAADGTYRFSLDQEGNLRYGANGKTYQISAAGERTLVFEASGLWDVKSGSLYGHSYGGNSITRRDVKGDRTLGPEEVFIDGLPFVKGLAVDAEGGLWILGYDDGDYVARISRGRVAERFNLDLAISVPGMEPRHILNSLTFGQGDFGARTAYILTWSGDILRLDLQSAELKLR